MVLILASEGLDNSVTIEQKTKTLFTVTYGAEVFHELTLKGALKTFSECVLHSYKCTEV